MTEVKLEDLVDAALPPDKVAVFIWLDNQWTSLGDGSYFDRHGTPTKSREARDAARRRLKNAMDANREVTFRKFFKVYFKPPAREAARPSAPKKGDKPK